MKITAERLPAAVELPSNSNPENPRKVPMTNLAAIPVPVEKVRPIRRKRGRMIILSPQEMFDLLKAARKRSARDWAMILLSRHGLRVSEVCGIKLGDVNQFNLRT
jgi:integrase